MLQAFLTPAGLGLIFGAVVTLLGLWGFKYFEPRKPPETQEQQEAKRKADKEWFLEQWDQAILKNTTEREREIRKVCIAEFVLRDEYRRDSQALQASMTELQGQLARNTSEIEHMKADIKRTADASEKTNEILDGLRLSISSIDGAWRQWKEHHGPLNGGN